MKKFNVTKKDLVLGAALVIFCFVLGMVSIFSIDTGLAYTDEELVDIYIDRVYGEDCYGTFFDEYSDEDYLVFNVYRPDGTCQWWSTVSKNYMTQRVERGY